MTTPAAMLASFAIAGISRIEPTPFFYITAGNAKPPLLTAQEVVALMQISTLQV